MSRSHVFTSSPESRARNQPIVSAGSRSCFRGHSLGVRLRLDFVLEQLAPPEEELVDSLGADDRLPAKRELCGVQQERARLWATEPAVERDQLFEGTALF